jgi:hypothetical protein
MVVTWRREVYGGEQMAKKNSPRQREGLRTENVSESAYSVQRLKSRLPLVPPKPKEFESA